MGATDILPQSSLLEIFLWASCEDCSSFAEAVAGPLAFNLAAVLGPVSCARLARCGHKWRRSARASLAMMARDRLGAGATANELEAALASAVGRPHCDELLDAAFVAVAREPEVASRCGQRGLPPLHLAARRGHPRLLLLLLEARAPANLRCGDGRTPLHCAAIATDSRCVSLLLQARADPQLRDAGRCLPLELAVRAGAEEAQEALLRSMQDGTEVTCCRGLGACRCSVS
mmetsp:Transcript_29674/g.84900  ORF Transcript_29674/g.84900 Transcript_29674/m.84900 type:complete len:231 (-) Transcript_29674:83-775(-)